VDLFLLEKGVFTLNVVIAPNAFKECLSACSVAQAIKKGVKKACPEAETVLIPVADGGDGTCEALVAARKGIYREINVNDPLMRPLYVKYGFIDDGKTAVMEMASASGLWILSEDEKNPLHTTTFGTGEMIRDALEQGVETIIIGIGGSATVDGGIGMASALGYRLLDENGNDIHPTGQALNSIRNIDSAHVHPRLKAVRIEVACDVTNPLLGPQGAVAVYAPQKGAAAESLPILEEGLSCLAECWKRDCGVDIQELPGAGAAGGLGAGLVAFCGANLRPGFDLVAEYALLDEWLKQADLVITGEGKIDESTSFGKVPVGVGRHAKLLGVPAVVLAGSVSGDLSPLYQEGIAAVFSIASGPMRLEESMQRAKELLENTAEQTVRLWLSRN
jgi:glycerate 2-kinase